MTQADYENKCEMLSVINKKSKMNKIKMKTHKVIYSENIKQRPVLQWGVDK